MSGERKGKAEIFENFARFNQLADGFEQEIHDVRANDDHTVALVSLKATRNGEDLEANQVFVFHIEDERVQSAWVHNFDDYKTDEFWSA